MLTLRRTQVNAHDTKFELFEDNKYTCDIWVPNTIAHEFFREFRSRARETPNRYSHWSSEDVARLRSMVKRKRSVKYIADILGRTESSIKNKKIKLGLRKGNG